MSSPVSNFDYEKINNTAKIIFNAFNSSKIDHREMYLLSEILKRESEKMDLPNVKWVQNELGISFTKLKSMLVCLENRGFIIKISSKKDHRIKFIDITDDGKEFFMKVSQLTYNAFL